MWTRALIVIVLCGTSAGTFGQEQAGDSSVSAGAVPVHALNFARAESDMYFARTVKQAGGLARFHHIRGPEPVDKQEFVRMNRDTLYSAAVF
jgi:hypothetical protein